jgi:hypothetical protein
MTAVTRATCPKNGAPRLAGDTGLVPAFEGLFQGRWVVSGARGAQFALLRSSVACRARAAVIADAGLLEAGVWRSSHRGVRQRRGPSPFGRSPCQAEKAPARAEKAVCSGANKGTYGAQLQGRTDSSGAEGGQHEPTATRRRAISRGRLRCPRPARLDHQVSPPHPEVEDRTRARAKPQDDHQAPRTRWVAVQSPENARRRCPVNSWENSSLS